MLSKRSLILVLVALLSASGCETFQKAQRADQLEIEAHRLRQKVKELERARDNQLNRERLEQRQELRRLARKKDKQISSLDKARRDLEQQLKKEIGQYQAKLSMTERGLVITFISEIFFDSGKDKIRTDGRQALLKVAETLNKQVGQSYVAIEGHTDNQPIKHSGWKSNWELSTARSLAVLHFLIDEGNIKPWRLSAVGFGEYRPLASNSTTQGRQQNRRVEIVILPTEIKKVKDSRDEK